VRSLKEMKGVETQPFYQPGVKLLKDCEESERDGGCRNTTIFVGQVSSNQRTVRSLRKMEGVEMQPSLLVGC